MSYSKAKPIPEQNEKGIYFMTEKYCREISDYNGYSSIPQYISTIHLHFKAFSKIENLNSFVNLRVIYLENNCISKIENLDHLPNLQVLQISNNFIDSFEEIAKNPTLRILSLSHNRIKTVPDIKLPYLETLNLDSNLIEWMKDVENLRNFPKLSVLGLSDNNIENDMNCDYIEFGPINEENVSDLLFFKVLRSIPDLKVLYFKGNELLRKIPNYRRRMIKELENLTYLDDKPIDECERLSVNAFWIGGLKAERETRSKYRLERDFGHIVKKQQDKDKVEIEKMREQSIKSIQNEYQLKKALLKSKKASLLKEYESLENNIQKSNIYTNLLSIDNQIEENEKFKIEEENNQDKVGIMVKRGGLVSEVNSSEIINEMMTINNDTIREIKKESNYENENENTELCENQLKILIDEENVFVFEDWMDLEFEFYLIQYLWDFNQAVESFKSKFSNNIKNINLLTERDLRIRMSFLEMERLKLINNDSYVFENYAINTNSKSIDNSSNSIAKDFRNINFEDVD